MISPSTLAPYAHHTLSDAVISELPGHYRGKVRENYDLRNGTRILIATDRVSAFDRNLAVIPLKGQVLRSEEHTSELQSQSHLVCRLLLETKTCKIAARVAASQTVSFAIEGDPIILSSPPLLRRVAVNVYPLRSSPLSYRRWHCQWQRPMS